MAIGTPSGATRQGAPNPAPFGSWAAFAYVSSLRGFCDPSQPISYQLQLRGRVLEPKCNCECDPDPTSVDRMKLPFLLTVAGRAAQVDEFGHWLPNGSDTRLGEGCVRLSRGGSTSVWPSPGGDLPSADGVDG
jgi:hypothetical protein